MKTTHKMQRTATTRTMQKWNDTKTWTRGGTGRMVLMTGLTVLLAANLACSDGNTHHDGHEMQGMQNGNHDGMHSQMANRQTKTLEMANAKVVVDWMSMGQHHQMMDSMKMDRHDRNRKNDDRHIMITVLDSKSNKTLSDATVTLDMKGPGGNSLEVNPSEMKNDRMHHLGYSFANAGEGTYTATIKVQNGSDSETREVTFELE